MAAAKGLEMFPYIVLDVNVLRCETTIDESVERCRQHDFELLLPDAIGYEQCKNVPHAFETIRGSLILLSKYSHLVCVCRRLPDMGREEVASQTPVSSIVEQPATEIFRNALSRLNKGDDGVLRAMLTGEFEKRVHETNDIWNDHERLREVFTKLGDQLKQEFTGDLPRRLRSNDTVTQNEALIELLSSRSVLAIAYQNLNRKGLEDHAAINLLIGNSIETRFLLGLLTIAAIWLAKGGLSNAKGEKLSNDLTDMEYAIMGSVCFDFATKDGKSKTTSELIRNVHSNWRTKITSLIN